MKGLIGMQRCSRCKQDKDASDFHKNQAYCKICQRTYNRERYSDPSQTRVEYIKLAAQGLRVCTHCKATKPFEAFCLDSCNVITGRYPICKSCVIAKQDAKRTKPKQGTPEFRPRRFYGLSIGEYEALKVEQNGQCRCCGIIPTRGLVVDHAHATNKFRGLLCNNCNVGLGYFRDDPELLRKAANYLEVSDHT